MGKTLIEMQNKLSKPSGSMENHENIYVCECDDTFGLGAFRMANLLPRDDCAGGSDARRVCAYF
jgi:hypothetical protein